MTKGLPDKPAPLATPMTPKKRKWIFEHAKQPAPRNVPSTSAGTLWSAATSDSLSTSAAPPARLSYLADPNSHLTSLPTSTSPEHEQYNGKPDDFISGGSSGGPNDGTTTTLDVIQDKLFGSGSQTGTETEEWRQAMKYLEADLGDLSDCTEPEGSDTEKAADRAEKKKTKRGRRSSRNEENVKKGHRRIIQKLVKEARENSVQFPSFSFADAMDPSARHRNDERFEENEREYVNDARPRLFKSSDNVDLVYHLPDFLNEKAQRLNFNAMMAFGHIAHLTVGKGADAACRNSTSSYRSRPGELKGLVKIVTGWHGIGHTHEPAVVSSDLIRNGTQFSAATLLLSETRLLSHRINHAYKLVDPIQYDALNTLYHRRLAKYPYAKALSCIDPLQMEGRAIMYNRQTPDHTDNQDPPPSWAVILVLGTFEMGTLRIRRLKLRLRYKPGDLIFLRGRILGHEVEAWGDGQRISVAHFTHNGLWREFDMVCP